MVLISHLLLLMPLQGWPVQSSGDGNGEALQGPDHLLNFGKNQLRETHSILKSGRKLPPYSQMKVGRDTLPSRDAAGHWTCHVWFVHLLHIELVEASSPDPQAQL